MKASKPLYVASACLVGLPCRFDGSSKPCPKVASLYMEGKISPICPESLGGLEIPREPCEQKGNQVISRSGQNRTSLFMKGAELAFDAALASGCVKAIVKSRSPSCGLGEIYDGSFSKRLCKGDGLWTQKLLAAGFEIWTEENLPDSI